MSNITPAPYSNTDAAEQNAVNTFKELINTQKVKDVIQTRDKFPNIDGFIELVDEYRIPYGKFDVQIRKLPEGHTSYSCPSSLVEYSKKSTLPIVLICVDVDNKKAYWRQINASMPEYKENQESFTIHFVVISDTIDQQEFYIQKWSEMISDYQKRISDYPTLKSEVAKKITLEGIEPSDIGLLQRYVDTINNLLDNDFIVVKEARFSDVWKLGIGLFDINPKTIMYQLYKIRYEEPFPLIIKIDRNDLLPEHHNPNVISQHWEQREYFGEPELSGRKYVLDHLKKMVEKRELRVRGPLASEAILFDFIDSYHNCLGIDPDENNYPLVAIDQAMNQYLLGICAATILDITEGRIDFSIFKLDLDQVNKYVVQHNLRPISPSEIPIRFLIGTKRFDVKSAYDALRNLLSNHVETLSRPFARRSRRLTIGDNWIWSGYTEEDEIHNVSLILNESLHEYEAFVKGNKLNLPKSVYLDPDIAIIYEYQPVTLSGFGGPEIIEHRINNQNHHLPKLSANFITHEKSPLDISEFPIIGIEGEKYQLITSSRGGADFLFHRNPVMNILYRMLCEDLSDNYDLQIMISNFS